MKIETALDNFVSRYIDAHQLNNTPMVTEFDHDWVSPCLEINKLEINNSNTPTEIGEQIYWQPTKQLGGIGLDDLAKALEIEINAELVTYFTRYWSDNLNASTQRGNLQLLLPWNQQDFEHLQQNLIGHVLMKRRLRQPDTFFIAVTDEEDFIISVDNASGNVMLEQVGVEPTDILATNLAEFLNMLTPEISKK